MEGLYYDNQSESFLLDLPNENLNILDTSVTVHDQ
jgi:hypothetical protein